MLDPLRAMRQRFQGLPPDQKDTLRALRLLTVAGVLPFSHKRLLGMLQRVFHRTFHLGDCLDASAEAAFLRRPAAQDAVSPEAAYLLGAVTYTEGKNPREDFSPLADVLAELEDDMGLVYLGNTYSMHPIDDAAQAMTCYERALNFRPDNIAAL